MSEDSSGGGEKTFDPTPQKLAEARRKGDIPRSQDVTAAAVYLGFYAVILTVGAFAVQHAASVLMMFLSRSDQLMGKILGPGGSGLMASIMGEALWALAPLFAVPIVAVLVSLLGQQAVTISGDKLMPKLSKLSILKNAKNKFGPTGLMEFAKSFTKLLAIGFALSLYLISDLDRMIGASQSDAKITGALMMQSLVVLVGITCIISVSIAGLDLVWQRFDHARKLKMSYQDLRDEAKQSEGDPYMKAQRRQRAQAIATNHMLLDVPKADVIIVNPTHFSVALQWSRDKGSAPLCIAKGENEIALRIREIAGTAEIPIHSDPPTARALYATVEIGAEIPPEHYRAVAAAIRFSDKLRNDARARGK